MMEWVFRSYRPKNWRAAPFRGHVYLRFGLRFGAISAGHFGATANIPGYISGAAPSIVLTVEQHNATRAVFNTWRAERGWGRQKIDWTRVSPQEVQALTYRMFEAAGVPEDAVASYFQAFHRNIYGH